MEDEKAVHMQNIVQAKTVPELVSAARPKFDAMLPHFNRREFTDQLIEDFEYM